MLRNNQHIGHDLVLSYNNGIIHDLGCDSSDYESSIDDDEESFEKCMMEEMEANHAENGDVSMDITDYSGKWKYGCVL